MGYPRKFQKSIRDKESTLVTIKMIFEILTLAAGVAIAIKEIMH